jgi:hypothetical protein
MVLKPEFVPVTELSADDIALLVQIGREQAAIQAALIDQLAEALEAGDTLRALNVARELVGLNKK